jgi:hypothetical protein
MRSRHGPMAIPTSSMMTEPSTTPIIRTTSALPGASGTMNRTSAFRVGICRSWIRVRQLSRAQAATRETSRRRFGSVESSAPTATRDVSSATEDSRRSPEGFDANPAPQTRIWGEDDLRSERLRLDPTWLAAVFPPWPRTDEAGTGPYVGSRTRVRHPAWALGRQIDHWSSMLEAPGVRTEGWQECPDSFSPSFGYFRCGVAGGRKTSTRLLDLRSRATRSMRLIPPTEGRGARRYRPSCPSSRTSRSRPACSASSRRSSRRRGS